MEIQLTQHAKGAGCGCKIAPAILQDILRGLGPQTADPRLRVGFATGDDAAAYELPDGSLLLSTTDFFTPILDDAYDFGRVAAANALSDIYAMGGRPLVALAILGWPVEQLPTELAGRVLAGGQATCQAAGIPLAGGHSIEAPEPFFGLAVQGLVPAGHLKQNHTARPGDQLLLTKPLGTGLITTALKRCFAEAAHVQAATDSMAQLNAAGALLGTLSGVTAMTDVTGFGLAGHLGEMLTTTRDAELDFAALPLLPGVTDYIAKDAASDGLMRNYKGAHQRISPRSKEEMYLLCDPQTNGGLLVAVAPDALASVQQALSAAGQHTWHVGQVLGGSGKIRFR